jgi:mono/diheme cytochrome c family protein
LPPGDALEGKKIFVELECYKCHEIKGESFPLVGNGDKGIGPELSQMAGKHPSEFFAESIVNPNAVIDPQDKEMGFLGPDGQSRMPTYSDALTVKQVADLATYLSSFKSDKHSVIASAAKGKRGSFKKEQKSCVEEGLVTMFAEMSTRLIYPRQRNSTDE